MKLENIKPNLETKLVLNVGYPMGKTNAPRVYNKLFSLLDMNAIMLPVEIQKGELQSFMDAVKTFHIRYFFPTMPHKADIIPFLDEVDENSRILRSVNAVRIDENGKSYGVGLDGVGAVGSLAAGGAMLDGGEVMMLGTGGISGVIGLELARKGVKKLTMLNRTVRNAKEIASILAVETGMEVVSLASDPTNLDKAAKNADVFIQATPLGMAGFSHNHPYLGFIDRLPEHCTVFDVVINPPDTPVIAKAKAKGLKAIPGMNMLVGNVAAIFTAMFGVKICAADKRAALEDLCDYLGIAAPPD